MTNEKFKEESNEREIVVEHEGKPISFIHRKPNCVTKIADEFPAIIGEKLEQKNLQLPTFGQICSLAHSCLLNKDDYTKEVILYNDARLLGFTGTLLTEKGIYIEDNPKRNGKEIFSREGTRYGSWFSMDLNDIGRRLKDNDPNVRFVPKSSLEKLFPFGDYCCQLEGKEVERLLEEDYLIALVGSKQTAKKVVEFSMKEDEPYMNLYIPAVKNIVSLSALRFSCYTIFGNIFANDKREYSFGLKRGKD